MSVRKCADHARAPANLADDPLEWIVGLHLAPVIARKREVRQRWLRPTQPPWLGASHAASPSLRAPCPRRSGALLGVDGLQHSSDVGDLALRHVSIRILPYPLIEKDLLRSH